MGLKPSAHSLRPWHHQSPRCRPLALPRSPRALPRSWIARPLLQRTTATPTGSVSAVPNVCNSDFFRVRIMRYPAFVWIYGCSQIPEDPPFAHEDSPFFEGKDDRCHCSCACGKEEAYKYTDAYVVAQLKDARPSVPQTEAPSAQAMHASTEDLKAEAEAAEVV